jgi:hypothetical protein
MPNTTPDNKPELIPIFKEDASHPSKFLEETAHSLQEEIYTQPEVYHAALASGRLACDKEVVYYAFRDGEEEAVDRINNFITSRYNRYIEFDPITDDALYEDTQHLALLKQFSKSEGQHQEQLRLKVGASRLGFFVSRVLEWQEAAAKTQKVIVRKAG